MKHIRAVSDTEIHRGNSIYWLSPYSVSGTVLSTSYTFIHLILNTALYNKNSYSLFYAQETEAQRYNILHTVSQVVDNSQVRL